MAARLRRLAAALWMGALLCPIAAGAQAGIGGAFSLVGGGGRVVTSADLQGKFALIFFGYTGCPDICPTILYKIAQAMRLIGPAAAEIRPVFITIDPAHDTPALTARYAALFSPAIMGLSGTPAEIAAVEQAYHVYVGPRDPKTGAIAHSAILYVMRPDGSFATALPESVSVAELAKSLTRLVDQD